jgi:purine-binding chemotaxis protein CheW
MDTADSAGRSTPWVIVQIKKGLFALPTSVLRQMVMIPEVTAVPALPDYVRGVICLRGQVMPLVDLRRRMGLTSVPDEVQAFCKLMEDREGDHRRWLDELRRSVIDRCEFKLATDPHQCAFGKWYDTYRADDPWIAAQLAKFDAPHQRIHSLALEVKELLAREDPLAASRLINETGAATLASMIKLFADLKNMVRESRSETVAILSLSNRSVAATVDSPVAIEELAVEDLSALASSHNGMIRRLGKRKKNRDLVLIIEADRILVNS